VQKTHISKTLVKNSNETKEFNIYSSIVNQILVVI